MQISQLARMANTTVRTVRHYHQLGLLPVPQNPGVRDYDFTHLARLLRIRWLVQSGVPLDDVATLLSDSQGPHPEAPGADDLTALLADVDERIAELTAQRERLVAMLASVREGRGGSLLPHSLWQGYRNLEEAAEPAARADVVREREMLEAALASGMLPPWALAFGEGIDPAAWPASAANFAEFASLPDLDEESFEQLLPELAQRHLEWMIGFEPTIRAFVARARQEFSDEQLLAQVIQWCEAAYPHPRHQRYLRHSCELMARRFLGGDQA